MPLPENNRLGKWTIVSELCPSCQEIIIRVRTSTGYGPILLYPQDQKAKSAPPEVPEEYARDYQEAALVLSLSPKASAALSRRCLQNLLVEELKAKGRDLASQIDDVLTKNLLTPALDHAIDAVRNIGNLSAHPIKSQRTGEVLDVELGEAEWTLDTLGDLFDHLFVKPARLAERKATLNDKLAEAGKPPLKGPSEL